MNYKKKSWRIYFIFIIIISIFLNSNFVFSTAYASEYVFNNNTQECGIYTSQISNKEYKLPNNWQKLRNYKGMLVDYEKINNKSIKLFLDEEDFCVIESDTNLFRKDFEIPIINYSNFKSCCEDLNYTFLENNVGVLDNSDQIINLLSITYESFCLYLLMYIIYALPIIIFLILIYFISRSIYIKNKKKDFSKKCKNIFIIILILIFLFICPKTIISKNNNYPLSENYFINNDCNCLGIKITKDDFLSLYYYFNINIKYIYFGIPYNCLEELENKVYTISYE
jgi:hypothetical protein